MAAGRKTGGRAKGTPNKLTALLKDDILEAAEGAHPDGRIAYLTAQAKDNPSAFLTLLGKVLPLQVHGPGENGEHTLVFKTIYETK
jgi:hypothetical protein